MQSKGAVKLFAILLVIGCIYQLSFSFITRGVEKKAAAYAAAYDEVLQGVETIENAAQVVGIELYDLNGRRINVATQGIVIVKKYMSDGSIDVQKIIKK